jgi:hypothetical protein
MLALSLTVRAAALRDTQVLAARALALLPALLALEAVAEVGLVTLGLPEAEAALVF